MMTFKLDLVIEACMGAGDTQFRKRILIDAAILEMGEQGWELLREAAAQVEDDLRHAVEADVVEKAALRIGARRREP